MIPNKAYFNWSGGKDSALALYQMRSDPSFEVGLLLTSINAAYNRVSMHGVRTELLRRQAESINIPLQLLELPENPSMDHYNSILHKTVNDLKDKQFTHAIFGDIFLEDLRAYRELQLQNVGMKAHFPIWKRDTKALLDEFLNLGFKAIVVCVKSDCLDESFVGRVIDRSFINDLPHGVDICGENGEYHSFVYDGPMFSKPVKYELGEKVYREYQSPKSDKNDCFTKPETSLGFWFCDLLPVE